MISPIWYFSTESEQAIFEPLFEDSDYPEGLPSSAESGSSSETLAGRFFAGSSLNEKLGSFTLRFKDTPGALNKPIHQMLAREEHEEEFAHTRRNWHYFGVRVPKNVVWRGKGG